MMLAATASEYFLFAGIIGLGVLIALAGALLLRRWSDKRHHRKARMRLQGVLAVSGVLVGLGLILAVPFDDSVRDSVLTFYGVLIAAIIGLTSTTYVGNFFAGLILSNRGSFSKGDYIQSRDLFGGVTDQKLLHTEVETADGGVTLIPNLQLVTEPLQVITRDDGAVVFAEVSLGYEWPNDVVARILKEAGADAGLHKSTVLITDLGDFSVTYRVAGQLFADRDEAKAEQERAGGSPAASDESRRRLRIISTRSLLRKKILDHLHFAGIEIVSPAFMNQRQLADDDHFIPKVRLASLRSDQDAESAEEGLLRKVEKVTSVAELEDALKEIEASLSSLDGAERVDANVRIEQLKSEIKVQQQEDSER